MVFYIETFVNELNLDNITNIMNFFILTVTCLGIFKMLFKTIIENLNKHQIEILVNTKWDDVKQYFSFCTYFVFMYFVLPLFFPAFFIEIEQSILSTIIVTMLLLFIINLSLVYIDFIIVFLKKLSLMSSIFEKINSWNIWKVTIRTINEYIFHIFFASNLTAWYFINSLFLRLIKVYEKKDYYTIFSIFIDFENTERINLLWYYLIINIVVAVTFLAFITISKSNKKKFLKEKLTLNIKTTSGIVYKNIKVLNTTNSDYVIQDKDENELIIPRSLVEEIILPKNQNEYTYRSYTQSRGRRRR